jgi:multicomponent Na+:H+ antiporter subunit D
MAPAGSSLLNAAYFLPIVHRAWFREPSAEWPDERDFGFKETAWALLLPPVVTALLALGAGLLASTPFSPLEWARLVAQREFYGP